MSRSPNPDLRDIGAAAENIILSLWADGVGSCWIASLDKDKLKAILNIPDKYRIDSVIAGGFPAEYPQLEEDSCNVKYWLDDKNRLHVPKRPLRDILRFNKTK